MDRTGPGCDPRVVAALQDVYDPCCAERRLSVVDMGLLRSAEVRDGTARVELVLTSGWCPFAAHLLDEVQERVGGIDGVDHAGVDIVWDEPWTTDRLSDRARDALVFLPMPSALDPGGREAVLRRAKETRQ